MTELLGNHAREVLAAEEDGRLQREERQQAEQEEGGEEQPADERVADEVEEVGHRDDAQLRPRERPRQDAGAVLALAVLLERALRRRVGERGAELEHVRVEQQPAEDEQAPVVPLVSEARNLHRVPVDEVAVRDDAAREHRRLEGLGLGLGLGLALGFGLGLGLG